MIRSVSLRGTEADQAILPTVRHSANDVALLIPQSGTDELEMEKVSCRLGERTDLILFLRSSECYSLEFK